MAKEIVCPACGANGAIKTLWKIKCPNRSCVHCDMELMQEAESRGPAIFDVPPEVAMLKGDFNPGGNSLDIRYRNHRGQDRVYTGDRTSIRRKLGIITIRLAPTGRRVNFDWKRIRNRDEVEAAMKHYPAPSGVENQIIGYHRKHGGTSPRIEEIRRKYPHLFTDTK